MRISITESAFVNAGLAILGDSNFSETAVNYIQDNYFLHALQNDESP